MKLMIQDEQGNTILEREIREDDVTLRVRVKAGSLPSVRRDEKEEPAVRCYH